MTQCVGPFLGRATTSARTDAFERHLRPAPRIANRGMQENERALEAVRSVVQKHLSGLDVRVFLFGSWARGTARRTSDIDVAVLGPKPLPPGVLPRLREALAESRVPYEVEVVDLSDASPAFRKRVLEEGVAWSV